MDLRFAHAASVRDLRTYLQRLDSLASTQALFDVRGSALAVYGCALAPETLLDTAPTVLVMRAFGVHPETAEAVAPRLTRIYEIRSLNERFARGLDDTLPLPPTESPASWAGIVPPHRGWQHMGEIDRASLHEVVRVGSRQVAEALPENPGTPLVTQVRHRVWQQTIAPGIPAAAAFGLVTAGLLPEGGPHVSVAAAAGWLRLSTGQGHALIRTSLSGTEEASSPAARKNRVECGGYERRPS